MLDLRYRNKAVRYIEKYTIEDIITAIKKIEDENYINNQIKTINMNYLK